MNLEEYHRAKELESLGARLGGELADPTQSSLSIAYMPSLSEAYDVADGKTELLAWVAVANHSARIIRIQLVQIRFPWTVIRLLPKPRKVDDRGDSYYIPLDLHHSSLHIDTVVNHRLRRGECILPEECFEGWFLGSGIYSIPFNYVEAGKATAELLILAAGEPPVKLDLPVAVLRPKPPKNRQLQRKRWEPLFAHRDAPESPEPRPTSEAPRGIFNEVQEMEKILVEK
jgi:hypothetical protein